MSSIALGAGRDEPFSVREFVRAKIEDWSALCQKAIEHTRRNFIERDAAPTELAEHRRKLRLLIGFGRGILYTASDPDFPDRRMVDELHGRIVQLEHLWRMVHEPMPEAEADAILAKVFPE